MSAPATRPRGGLGRLKLALGALAVVFVAWAAWDLARRWDAQALELDWRFAVSALVPVLVSTAIAAQAWVALIERMAGRRVPRRFARRLYMDSQLARYTPGKLGLPLVRMAGAERLGLAARAVGSSVLIEVAAWLAVGGTIGFGALALFGRHLSGALAVMGGWAPIAVLLLVLGTLLLVLLDRRCLPVAWLELTGEGPLVPAPLLGYQFVNWLSWLVHGYLVARAVGAEPALALGSAGLFVLAPIAGFVALAAPAGIGVREALLSVGLAPAVGAAPALSAALLSRAASLVGELAAWLWARLAARRDGAEGELGRAPRRS